MGRFQRGERVRIVTTGEAAVIRVEHAGTGPPKYTVRVDPRPGVGAESSRRPADRIYAEDKLEPLNG